VPHAVKHKGTTKRDDFLDTGSAIAMSWAKFERTILPKALSIRLVTDLHRRGFYGIPTAVNADAPPILKWDREEQRNPFAVYTYHSGSTCKEWNLPSNSYVKVTGIVANPYEWFNPEHTYGETAGSRGLMLENCFDAAGANRNYKHNCLFPGTLRSELHEVRATIESYSQNATLHGVPESSASGLSINNMKQNPIFLVVKTLVSESTYLIDNFE
jgi:hypothetical protein